MTASALRRLAIAAVSVAVIATASATLAQPAPDRPAGTDTELAGDAWDFEDDDEEAVTWERLAADQGVDLALTTAFLALALVSFAKRSVVLRYATLAAAVVYLGFYKSQLLSIVNVFGAMTGTLPVFAHNLTWYLFAGFALVSTVAWGRLYCGRLCAFGALTQLMDRVVPARLRFDVPERVERRLAPVKYVLLAAVIGYMFATSDTSIYRYVEPFWMFGRQADPVLWAGLGVLLVATVFVRNLYCRFLCPTGAALGLLSTLTVFRIKRWSECNTCRICEKTCEWGAIRGPKILVTECVRCDDCERLYEDTQKCPHWIIIQRKDEVMARRSAAPAAGARP